jgi:putative endopeptidase
MRPLSRYSQASVACALLALSTVAAAQQQQGTARALGIDTTNFDRSVRPQDDFFRFVNGSWLKKTAIPADASSWGAFNELTEKSRTALHSILENAAKTQAPAGSDQRKVGDLYASFMDSARVEQLGINPLQSELARIRALKSSAQLPTTFAHFTRLGLQNPFAVSVGQDPKNSSVNIVQIGQSGLGLPDRD